MKIIKNIGEPTVDFKSLKIGDAFLDYDKKVCIKIPKVYDDFSGMETESLLEGCMDADDFYEHAVNVYNFEEKKFLSYDDYAQVKPLQVTMEVELKREG